MIKWKKGQGDDGVDEWSECVDKTRQDKTHTERESGKGERTRRDEARGFELGFVVVVSLFMIPCE